MTVISSGHAVASTRKLQTPCSITTSASAVQWQAVWGESQLDYHKSSGAVAKSERRRRVPPAQWDAVAISTECFPVSGIVKGFEFTVKNPLTLTVGLVPEGETIQESTVPDYCFQLVQGHVHVRDASSRRRGSMYFGRFDEGEQFQLRLSSSGGGNVTHLDFLWNGWLLHTTEKAVDVEPDYEVLVSLYDYTAGLSASNWITLDSIKEPLILAPGPVDGWKGPDVSPGASGEASLTLVNQGYTFTRFHGMRANGFIKNGTEVQGIRFALWMDSETAYFDSVSLTLGLLPISKTKEQKVSSSYQHDDNMTWASQFTELFFAVVLNETFGSMQVIDNSEAAFRKRTIPSSPITTTRTMFGNTAVSQTRNFEIRFMSGTHNFRPKLELLYDGRLLAESAGYFPLEDYSFSVVLIATTSRQSSNGCSRNAAKIGVANPVWLGQAHTQQYQDQIGEFISWDQLGWRNHVDSTKGSLTRSSAGVVCGTSQKSKVHWHAFARGSIAAGGEIKGFRFSPSRISQSMVVGLSEACVPHEFRYRFVLESNGHFKIALGVWDEIGFGSYGVGDTFEIRIVTSVEVAGTVEFARNGWVLFSTTQIAGSYPLDPNKVYCPGIQLEASWTGQVLKSSAWLGRSTFQSQPVMRHGDAIRWIGTTSNTKTMTDGSLLKNTGISAWDCGAASDGYIKRGEGYNLLGIDFTVSSTTLPLAVAITPVVADNSQVAQADLTARGWYWMFGDGRALAGHRPSGFLQEMGQVDVSSVFGLAVNMSEHRVQLVIDGEVKHTPQMQLIEGELYVIDVAIKGVSQGLATAKWIVFEHSCTVDNAVLTSSGYAKAPGSCGADGELVVPSKCDVSCLPRYRNSGSHSPRVECSSNGGTMVPHGCELSTIYPCQVTDFSTWSSSVDVSACHGVSLGSGSSCSLHCSSGYTSKTPGSYHCSCPADNMLQDTLATCAAPTCMPRACESGSSVKVVLINDNGIYNVEVEVGIGNRVLQSGENYEVPCSNLIRDPFKGNLKVRCHLGGLDADGKDCKRVVGCLPPPAMKSQLSDKEIDLSACFALDAGQGCIARCPLGEIGETQLICPADNVDALATPTLADPLSCTVDSRPITCLPYEYKPGLRVELAPEARDDVLALRGMTDEKLVLQAREFCGAGNPAFLMGLISFGLDLVEMNKIVFDAEQPLVNYEPLLMQNCSQWGLAFFQIHASAAEFLASIDAFQLVQLRYKVEMQNEVDLMKQQLFSQDTRGKALRASPAEVIEKIKDIYRKVLVSSGPESFLLHALEDLVLKAEDFEKVITDRSLDYENFLQKCNRLFLGIGPDDEYILNLGSQQGVSNCIEEAGSKYVGVFCGVNPITAFLNDPKQSTRIPGRRAVQKRRLTEESRRSTGMEGHSASAAQSNHRSQIRSLTKEEGPIEICAWSRKISQETLKVHKQVIQDLGRYDIIDQFENEKLAKHEAYYSKECEGQRRLSGASELKMKERGQQPSSHLRQLGAHEALRQCRATTLDDYGVMCPQGTGEFRVAHVPGQTKVDIIPLLFNGRRDPQAIDSYLAETCEIFCGEGSIPLMLGYSTVAFSLSDMNKICLDDELLGRNRNQTESCNHLGAALLAILDAVVEWKAKMDTQTSAQLLYSAQVEMHIQALQAQLLSVETKEALMRANSKVQAITELYQQIGASSPQLTNAQEELTRALTQLRQASSSLIERLRQERQNLVNFVRQCNGIFLGLGPEQTYLLDLGSQTGTRCLEEDESKRVGCCCGYNPASRLGEQRFSGDGEQETIPAEARPFELGGGRKLQESSSLNAGQEQEHAPSAMFVCALAFEKSWPDVQRNQAKAKSLGFADVLESYHVKLQQKYGVAYIRGCGSKITTTITTTAMATTPMAPSSLSLRTTQRGTMTTTAMATTPTTGTVQITQDSGVSDSASPALQASLGGLGLFGAIVGIVM